MTSWIWEQISGYFGATSIRQIVGVPILINPLETVWADRKPEQLLWPKQWIVYNPDDKKDLSPSCDTEINLVKWKCFLFFFFEYIPLLHFKTYLSKEQQKDMLAGIKHLTFQL